MDMIIYSQTGINKLVNYTEAKHGTLNFTNTKKFLKHISLLVNYFSGNMSVSYRATDICIVSAEYNKDLGYSEWLL